MATMAFTELIVNELPVEQLSMVTKIFATLCGGVPSAVKTYKRLENISNYFINFCKGHIKYQVYIPLF